MRLFKAAPAVSAAGRGTPMLNDSNLIENKNRIIEAMKFFHISSTDIFFLSDIVEDAKKDIKVSLLDVNVLFNPDEAGDQVSSEAFADFLRKIFKGRDIRCETYADFAEHFATACKPEKITNDEIVDLFKKAIERIKEIHTVIEVDGASSPVGKTGFKL